MRKKNGRSTTQRGLIKSITSFGSRARFSRSCSFPSSPSLLSLTPNSHNCFFFLFVAPCLTIGSLHSPLSSLLVSSRSASLRSFIYAYFDPSTCHPTLVRARSFLPLPLSFSHVHFSRFISSPPSCFTKLFSLSSFTSSLNNCEPAVLLFLLPAPPHSTKGC